MNVWVVPTELILNVVHDVPIANVCDEPPSPFKLVIHAQARVAHVGVQPLIVRTCQVDPRANQTVFPARERPLLKVKRSVNCHVALL